MRNASKLHQASDLTIRLANVSDASQLEFPNLKIRDRAFGFEMRIAHLARAWSVAGGGGQQTHAKTKQKSLDECVGSKALGSSGDPRTHLVFQRVLVYLHRAALPPPGKSVADGFHVEPNGLVPRYDVLEHLELVETDRVTLGDAVSYGCAACRRDTENM